MYHVLPALQRSFSSYPKQLYFKLNKIVLIRNHAVSRSAWLLFVLFHAALQTFAQPAVQWSRTIGSSSYDALNNVMPTSDGGFIVGGISGAPVSGDITQSSKGGSDYWIVKLSSDGVKQWDKTIGGNKEDVLRRVFQTPDGGYLLAGHSYSDQSGDKSQNDKAAEAGIRGDYWIVKLSAAGDVQWDKTVGSLGEDFLEDANLAKDGGYILSGITKSGLGGDKSEPANGEDNYDNWIVKLSADGQIQWDKTIGTPGNDIAPDIDVTDDGGYIIGGTSTLPATDCFITKLTADGSIAWRKGIGFEHGFINDIIQTKDGNYVLALYEMGNPYSPFYVISLDGKGNEIWRKAFMPSDPEQLPDYVTTIRQAVDGGYIVAGYTYTSSETGHARGAHDFWLVKMDLNGNKQWEKTIGGSLSDYLANLELTGDGGYIVAGSTNSTISGDITEPSNGQQDFLIFKLAPASGSNLLSFSSGTL